MARTDEVIAMTVVWLERVVIGLNLCPFAKAVHVKNQIRYAVSEARKSESLLADLKKELSLLVETPRERIESTLLIHPEALIDFETYNHFLDLCKLLLEEMNLLGVVQIASFHPDYQFAETSYDDVTNCTNRSPYPMLHLLREESVARATDAYPIGDEIYQRNMATMNAMGHENMKALMGAVTESFRARNRADDGID